MAATPPSNSKSSSGEQHPAGGHPVPLTFEDKLNQFWQKNRMAVLGLCALVLVLILGKGIYERIQRSNELEVETAYASATTPDQLRAFAAAHPGHELAGIAELRIADQAYTAEKFNDALAGYDKAISALKSGPLVARAKLGRGLSKIQTGKAAEGAEDLKQLANDSNQLKAVRAEAAYQLASLSADAGNTAEVQKYIEQLNQIDPASIWARRAMALQASLPRTATAPAAAAPAQPGGPNLQVKLPTK